MPNWAAALGELLERATLDEIRQAARMLLEQPLLPPEPVPTMPHFALEVDRWEAPGVGLLTVLPRGTVEVLVEVVAGDAPATPRGPTRRVSVKDGATVIPVELRHEGDRARVSTPDRRHSAITRGASGRPRITPED